MIVYRKENAATRPGPRSRSRPRPDPIHDVTVAGRVWKLLIWKIQELHDSYVKKFLPPDNMRQVLTLPRVTFHLSKGDPWKWKGWKTISLNPFTPKSDFMDFTLSNARRFHSSKGEVIVWFYNHHVIMTVQYLFKMASEITWSWSWVTKVARLSSFQKKV